MPMKPYTIRCISPGCAELAHYKIASHWTDGIISELKTYSICCDKCLGGEFASSMERHKKCRTIAGETLAVPAIFDLARGKSSSDLKRRLDLEANFLRSLNMVS